MVLKAFHLAIRVVLVLVCAFWALISVELLPPFFMGGLDGVRGKLVHIWSLGRIDLGWSCQESLQLLHEGYTDLFFFLVLTWGLVELKRFLDRRVAAVARLESIPIPPVATEL